MASEASFAVLPVSLSQPFQIIPGDLPKPSHLVSRDRLRPQTPVDRLRVHVEIACKLANRVEIAHSYDSFYCFL
jgi:hypothetical protein